MAVATAFDRYPAHTSGRVKPVGGALAGAYAFVLGCDQPGVFGNFVLGDHTEVSQAVDVTGLRRLGFALKLRGPAAVAGGKWLVTWRVGGVVQGSRVVLPLRTVTITDAGWDVSQLAGVQTLAIRLELVP